MARCACGRWKAASHGPTWPTPCCSATTASCTSAATAGSSDGRGLLGLNEPDGGADWLDGGALARLVVNYRSIRLAVLNACDSGQTDDGRAFVGLAPQLVAAGIPAVVAMQFPITDKAAATVRAGVLQAAVRGR